MSAPTPLDPDSLRASGLGHSVIAKWRADFVDATGDYACDCARYSLFWGRSNDLLKRLPPKPKRNEVLRQSAARKRRLRRKRRRLDIQSFLTAFRNISKPVMRATNSRRRTGR